MYKIQDIIHLEVKKDYILYQWNKIRNIVNNLKKYMKNQNYKVY